MKPLIYSPLAILLTAGLCLAQAATSQPAAPAAAGRSAATSLPVATSQPAVNQKVTVVSVTGQAQRCDATAGPKKWEPIQPGDVLNDLTLIRTGLSSGVVLNLGERGEVRVGAATKIGITEFRKEGALAKTSLGLKYGTIRAEVDSKKGPADFRVSTPTATLSVRGSEPEIAFGADMGTHGFSLEGVLHHLSAGQGSSADPGEGTDDHHTLPILLLITLFQAQGGDQFGLTGPEIQTIMLNNAGRDTLTGGPPVQTFQVIPLAPASGHKPPSQPGNPFFPDF